MRGRRARSVCATLALIAAPTAHALAASPPTPPPGTARLEGFFVLSGRVTVADNVRGEHVGESVRRAWGFIPLCPAGSCARIELERNRSGGADKLVLHRRSPAYYTGSGSFYAPLRCGNRVYRRGEAVPFTITVRVTVAEAVGTTAIAREIRAFYTNRARTNLTPCVTAPSHDAAIYHGNVVNAPTAPAPGAANGRSPAGS